MFDPFKRIRAKSTRKLRRLAVSAISDAWGPVLAPAKPAKRKRTKAEKPATGTVKSSATAPKGARNSSADHLAAKSTIPATSKAKMTVPRGAVFKNWTHESAFGTRSYMLYVPAFAKTAANPLPLIVMLHGCGQTSQDFARGTGMNVLAEEFGFLVLYPAQSREAHYIRCWNWYQRSDQSRGGGEPALIASLTLDVIAGNNVDPAKVYAAGLSAGASAALVVTLAYPDIFAAVGVHSGLPLGAARDASSVAVAMQNGAPGLRQTVKMPTIIFHGDSDKIINPRNGRFVAIRALGPYGPLDQTEKTGRVPGGRKYTRTAYRVGRGRSYAEHWVIHGSGHAWSGGNVAGSYTDPTGPDASREMVRFFLRHRTTKKRRSVPSV